MLSSSLQKPRRGCGTKAQALDLESTGRHGGLSRARGLVAPAAQGHHQILKKPHQLMTWGRPPNSELWATGL